METNKTNGAAGHPGCEGCSHRNHSENGNWCYMFEDAPSSLPCGQHDKFEAEREVMGKAIRRNPALLTMMVLAEMAKQEFEPPGRTQGASGLKFDRKRVSEKIKPVKTKMKYKVTVRRKEYREHTFEVEAGSEIEAEFRAMEMSEDHDFDENPVHYADEEVTSILSDEEESANRGDDSDEGLLREETSFERVALILSDILNQDIEKITPESKLVEDLGADSLDEVEIVMAIEEEFDIEIEDSEYAGVTTVAEILKVVEGKIANGRNGKE